MQWGDCNPDYPDSSQNQDDQQNSYEGYWDGRSASKFPTNELQRRGYGEPVAGSPCWLGLANPND